MMFMLIIILLKPKKIGEKMKEENETASMDYAFWPRWKEEEYVCVGSHKIKVLHVWFHLY